MRSMLNKRNTPDKGLFALFPNNSVSSFFIVLASTFANGNMPTDLPRIISISNNWISSTALFNSAGVPVINNKLRGISV